MFFTPQQFVLNSLLTYPLLYQHKDFEITRFKVMDQLLNVIGNGIRDSDELKDYLTYQKFDENNAERIANGETVWLGYYKVEKMAGLFEYGIGDSITVLNDEKENHPDIVFWQKINNSNSAITPYPNFDKKYSTVYKTNILSYGDDWKNAIKWFYEQCLEYFKGDYSSYHYAFPSKFPNEDTKHIDDMKTVLAKYETYDDITQAYGGKVIYDGDVKKFLTERWNVERQRIITYIEQVLIDIQ